jgi:para-aminobenzoate synthetase component 1
MERKYHTFDYLAGIDSVRSLTGGFDALEQHKDAYKDWLMGYLGYDLKNDIEHLYSQNKDGLNFCNLSFFQPRYVIKNMGDTWEVGYLDELDDEESAFTLIKNIEEQVEDEHSQTVHFKARVHKKQYCQIIESILNHIHKGDVYELNYCMEFYAENKQINPYASFNQLVRISPTPFASFFKFNSHYLLSASPERYLKKVQNKLISQPIKGTAPRGVSAEEDIRNRAYLQGNEKERSENVMIADLVRNDLSRVAQRGSVKVEELCGIYSFPQVFQMITTVVAQLEKGKSDVDAIKASFPMGSMTGAPKIRAMKLIEEYEETKRGLYAGAIGYFSPDGDFDFNVVIRSLLYNAFNHYLSFMVGSAITEKSVPEQEYNECLMKASAIFKLFNHTFLAIDD